MKKIAVIGCGGSGKSTLARKLGTILHLPVYHLDAIYWQPGWVPQDKAIFRKQQQKILENDTWIIDGNYSGTMDERLAQADTVIFLHYKTIRCLYGITKRRLQYRRKTRPDMGKDCPERLNWEFFLWVKNFNKTKAPAIYSRLSHYKTKKILIFKSPKELQNYLTELDKNR
ncbi:DNA topology modulation protein [Oceanobacillus saliphilus]|uniref:DNA topology modulation protein n=1 Tax=Oceanobacillus saliphilus TaxID=2925834 RepID=UPI00201D6E0B|nr:DNA topology modulation protein [Oceanobacillus saliphilus]